MDKPEWKDAPEWAEWLALDSCGEWYWYEFEPSWECERWDYSGAVMRAQPYFPHASETLEQRP